MHDRAVVKTRSRERQVECGSNILGAHGGTALQDHKVAKVVPDRLSGSLTRGPCRTGHIGLHALRQPVTARIMIRWESPPASSTATTALQRPFAVRTGGQPVRLCRTSAGRSKGLSLSFNLPIPLTSLTGAIRRCSRHHGGQMFLLIVSTRVRKSKDTAMRTTSKVLAAVLFGGTFLLGSNSINGFGRAEARVRTVTAQQCDARRAECGSRCISRAVDAGGPWDSKRVAACTARTCEPQWRNCRSQATRR